MLKYVDTKVTFSEIPDEITLCINLSNCPCHCEGCHSSYLAEDIGKVLTITRINKLIEEYKGISAICFMGGDNDPKLVNHYAKLIKSEYIGVPKTIGYLNRDIDILSKGIHMKKGYPLSVTKYKRSDIKVGWYSGRQELSKDIVLDNFDYIKLGPYIKDKGPLTSSSTNQVFYKVAHLKNGKSKLVDITYKFWKHET